MSKILVIEDSEVLRNDIIEMLGFEGYEVDGAPDGLVGVEKALAYLPDLIICDIMMPGLNGYGVLEKLRENQNTVATPFIFLTAKTDHNDVRQGMGLGADDYLTKPFVAAELLDAVSVRLERRETLEKIVDKRVQELSDSIITALPHELRTPLNTIIGFSDMLTMEATRLKPDQVAEWAQHINQAAQRLYRLVENYLLYVRAEVLSRNPAELESLKQHVLDHPGMILQFHVMHHAQTYGRDEDIKFNLTDEIAIRITDHDFGKIVEETIDNALKFSQPGTPIEISGQNNGKFYNFIITDHGRGMNQQQIDSIGAYMQFERWFYEQQGSGLGLAIVKRFIELYEGEFHLASEPDKGTTVTIKIPKDS